MQFRDVGDKHFMAIRLQLLRDSNRMRSRLQGNTGRRHSLKVFFYGAGYGAEPSFFNHVGFFIQNAVVTPLVTEIDANRHLVLGGLPGFLSACLLGLLVHALVSTRPSHHISQRQLNIQFRYRRNLEVKGADILR